MCNKRHALCIVEDFWCWSCQSCVIKLSCLVFSYNWSNTKTSTVNWYKGSLYVRTNVRIHIPWFMCVQVFCEEFVQCLHCTSLVNTRNQNFIIHTYKLEKIQGSDALIIHEWLYDSFDWSFTYYIKLVCTIATHKYRM